MQICFSDEQAKTALGARRGLEASIGRLRAAGFDCELTETRTGGYEKLALTCSVAGEVERVITDGWAIGERDNEARAIAMMTLEVLTLLGSL